MTSQEVVDAIKRRHEKDVFVTECKDGPTWTQSHSRMDIWTMRRSWSSPLICGYEIKVSKSDFKNDRKWQNYLPLCNQFYFACPKGLISVDEIPPEAGLVYVSNGRVRDAKKPQHREVSIPESLVVYLLMCRTRIVSPKYYEEPTKSDRINTWREWLEQRKNGREIGYSVSRAVREYVSKIEHENSRLKSEIDRISGLGEFLKSMGVDHNTWRAEERIKSALDVVPSALMDAINELSEQISRTKEAFSKLKENTENK